MLRAATYDILAQKVHRERTLHISVLNPFLNTAPLELAASAVREVGCKESRELVQPHPTSWHVSPNACYLKRIGTRRKVWAKRERDPLNENRYSIYYYLRVRILGPDEWAPTIPLIRYVRNYALTLIGCRDGHTGNTVLDSNNDPSEYPEPSTLAHS